MAALTSGSDGLRAAALLLAALGEEAGAAVLAHLNPQEVRRLAAASRDLDAAPRSEIEALLARYARDAQGCTGLAMDAARRLDDTLNRALGAARAGALLRELSAPTLNSLAELAWREPAEIAARLDALPVPARAVVVAQLPTDTAAQVLEALPTEARADILAALAHSAAPSADALAELDAWLTAGAAEEGEHAAARVLDGMSAGGARATLERLAGVDADLARKLANGRLCFEDLAQLPLPARQAFLRRIASRTLLQALKAAPPRLVDALLEALTPNAAARLKDDLDAQGQVALDAVEAAQDDALALLRQLAAEGALTHSGTAAA